MNTTDSRNLEQAEHTKQYDDLLGVTPEMADAARLQAERRRYDDQWPSAVPRALADKLAAALEQCEPSLIWTKANYQQATIAWREALREYREFTKEAAPR